MIDLSRLIHNQSASLDDGHEAIHYFTFNCPCGRVSRACAIAPTAEEAREIIIPALIQHVAAEEFEEERKKKYPGVKMNKFQYWNPDDCG